MPVHADGTERNSAPKSSSVLELPQLAVEPRVVCLELAGETLLEAGSEGVGVDFLTVLDRVHDIP